MQIWEVTNRASTPVMLCAAGDSLSDDEARLLIKGLLKRAKRDGISIHAISVEVQDDGTIVTLHGTAQT
jgi:hypothetical protein